MASVQCAICFEEYGEHRHARVLSVCGHDLCGWCINELLDRLGDKASCPTCRALLLPKQDSRDFIRILRAPKDPRSKMPELLRQDLYNRLFPICRGLSSLGCRALTRELSTIPTQFLKAELTRRESEVKSHLQKATPWLLGPFLPMPETDMYREDDGEHSAEVLLSGMALGWAVLWYVIEAVEYLIRILIIKPTRYFRDLPKEQQAQLLALGQGLPLLIGGTWFLYAKVHCWAER